MEIGALLGRLLECGLQKEVETNLRNSIAFDRILMSAVVLAIFGIAQFLVAMPTAMRHYAGGTLTSRTSVGYSWSQNWLSDLGRVSAWSGKDNAVARKYFSSSVILLGCTLAFFFVATLRAAEVFSFSAVVTSSAGLLSSLGLVGIGLTPFDVMHELHIFCLLMWILPMLGAAATVSYQAIRAGGVIATTIPVASLVLLLGVLAYGFSTASTHVMAMQKLAVLLSIAWLILLIGRVGLAAVYIVSAVQSRSRIANMQASKYMNRIQRGHLQPYKRYED